MKAGLAAVAGYAILAFPAASYCQEAPTTVPKSLKGWYATIGAGGSWASKPTSTYSESGNISGVNYSSSISTTTSFGGGFAGEIGAGYDFGNNIRSELTYIYTRPSLGSSSFNGNVNALGQNFPINGIAAASGSANTNSVLVSGYYDIPTKTRFRPYIGAGIGWTNVSIPSLTYSGIVNTQGTSTPFTTTTQGGNGSAFGYQAKAGVSYIATKNTDIFLEGTYQGNTSTDIQGVNVGAINQFGVRAGARYRFGS